MDIKRILEALLEVKILSALIIIIAFISPGFLFIFYFYRSIFLSLDFFELILLATIPALLVNLILTVPIISKLLIDSNKELERQFAPMEKLAEVGEELDNLFSQMGKHKEIPKRLRNRYNLALEKFHKVSELVAESYKSTKERLFERGARKIYRDVALNALFVFIFSVIAVIEQYIDHQHNARLFLAQISPYFALVFLGNTIDSFVLNRKLWVALYTLAIVGAIGARVLIGVFVWPD